MRFETLTADPSAPIRLTYTEKLVSVLNNRSCLALTGWHLEAESYFRKGATLLARSASMVIGPKRPTLISMYRFLLRLQL